MGAGSATRRRRSGTLQRLLAPVPVALASCAQLVGREETVTVCIELVEVLREARRVCLRLGAAHAAVAVGVDLLPMFGAARFVEGTQLVGADLAVVVRIDLVEMLRENGQRL